METLLVSSCLLGSKVRYNGSCLSLKEEDRKWLDSNFSIQSFCPEVQAGLPTPRAPAEIIFGTGSDVLDGTAQVVGDDSVDVSKAFVLGAEKALELCQSRGIKYAVLAESSPSCGSTTVYDGTFTGQKIEGRGVTAELLERNGIKVFSQYGVEDLKTIIKSKN